MYNMVLYLCVLIVFSLHRESLKFILAMDPLPRWFCHRVGMSGVDRMDSSTRVSVVISFCLALNSTAI
jgi:hypothetical protein